MFTSNIQRLDFIRVVIVVLNISHILHTMFIPKVMPMRFLII